MFSCVVDTLSAYTLYCLAWACLRGLKRVLVHVLFVRVCAAPYEIVDCEKRSEQGLTCNSVIMSVMEPPGNNVSANNSGMEYYDVSACAGHGCVLHPCVV